MFTPLQARSVEPFITFSDSRGLKGPILKGFQRVAGGRSEAPERTTTGQPCNSSASHRDARFRRTPGARDLSRFNVGKPEG